MGEPRRRRDRPKHWFVPVSYGSPKTRVRTERPDPVNVLFVGFNADFDELKTALASANTEMLLGRLETALKDSEKILRHWR